MTAADPGARPGSSATGEARVDDVPAVAERDPSDGDDPLYSEGSPGIADLEADASEHEAAAGEDPPAGDTAAAIRELVDDPDQSAEEALTEAVELAQRLESERNDYLDHLRRLKADFENYKRRVSAQAAEQRSQGALELVKELLSVLDGFDAAIEHGSEDVQPLRSQFLQTLEKQGLTVLDEVDVPFDPNVHEAVMHEDGEGDAVVVEVLRTGYLWNGRTARAAMVRVRG